MTFLEIAAFYVVAAVVFYRQLIVTAVDESALTALPYHRSHRTRTFKPVQRTHTLRPVPVRASAPRQMGGR